MFLNDESFASNPGLLLDYFSWHRLHLSVLISDPATRNSDLPYWDDFQLCVSCSREFLFVLTSRPNNSTLIYEISQLRQS